MGYSTSGQTYDVAVAGHYAYLAEGISGGLQVIDVSDPANPVRVGHCSLDINPTSVTVAGNYAYIDNGQIVDVSNPANPVVLSNQGIGGGDCVVRGNYAYVAYVYGLRIHDVSNPTNPVPVGGFDTGLAWGMALMGNYANVADKAAGLQVIDVSNPANPVRVGGCATSGTALDVAVMGNYAYVADGSNGLQVIDVSNPATPVRVGGYNPNGYAQRVTVTGHSVYLGDWYKGLLVFDVSNPATPVPAGVFVPPSGHAMETAVSGNYAYLANMDGGLAIFQIPGSGIQTTPLGWPNSTLRLSVPTTSGKSYALEYKNALSEAVWTPLPAVPGTGDALVLSDPAAPGTQRFYRVREE